MSCPPPPFATDEDIALRAPGDYRLLYPRDQKLANSDDGTIQPGDVWTLRSTSVDFQARGVEPGQIVLLSKAGSSLRPDGEGFVVVSVQGGSMVIRRPGQAIGAGEPPASMDGLTGLSFQILTFHPQIAVVGQEMCRRFGIAQGVVGGLSPAALADPGELRDAVVLTVLARQYFAMCRELSMAASGSSDTFAAKAQATRAELDDVLARLTLHWNRNSLDSGLNPPTTRFSTRMSR